MNQRIRWSFRTNRSEVSFVAPEPCVSFWVGNFPEADFVIENLPTGSGIRCALEEGAIRVTARGDLRVRLRGEALSEAVSWGSMRAALVRADGAEYLQLEAAADGDFAYSYDRAIDLGEGSVAFGNTRACQVRFAQIGVSAKAFELQVDAGGNAYIVARPTVLGVYLNNSRLAEGIGYPLRENDFIFTANVSFAYRGGQILTSAAVEVDGLPYVDSAEQNSHLDYPQMNRTTRFHDLPDTGTVTILDPPQLPEQEPKNLLLTIVPTLVMVVLIVFVRGSFSSNGGMILFSVLSMLVGLAGSVATYFETTRTQKRKKEEREEKYRQYIRQRREEIRNLREKERRVLRSIYCEPKTQLRNVREFSAELFDRVAEDDDFLDIRLGYGCLPSLQRIECRQHEVFEQMDELYQLPGELVREFAFNQGLPAVIRAREASAVGFQGDLASLRAMMNQTTLDLATRHYFADVELYYVCGDEFEAQLRAYRMLPHVGGKGGAPRNLACDPEDRNALLEKLYKQLSQREENPKLAEGAPWMVIFASTEEDVMRHPVMQFIGQASRLHAAFLFWGQHRENLPLGCRFTVKLFTNVRKGLLIDTFNREDDRLFSYEDIDDAAMEAVAKRLAPVFCGEMNLSGQLARSLTFYEMLGIRAVDEKQILENWSRADTRESLAAPLGVEAKGGLVELDLHEKAHGPHGLVAGTTGSGKSELLLSYVLSMAYSFSPEDVNFVIIDFKAPGMAGSLAGLPHLIGSITNLSKREMERSLASIRAERIRRSRILDDYNVKNINEYATEHRAGRIPDPLPHLIFIVDEFAELKAQQPEFMDELIGLARTGRSLGIHLILATQKPAGVVNDQIWSNSDFKLCLRVQAKEDSNEVLHSPLAAEIREPGRAYLQVGRLDLFELFQSGYSGAPAAGGEGQERVYRLDRVRLSGRREELYAHRPDAGDDGEAKLTQFDAVKRAVVCACERAGCKKPALLCLPPLPPTLPFAAGEAGEPFELPIGRYDHPSMQTQGDALYRVYGGNLLIAGAPQMGKTTVLLSILRAAAERMTAREINVYVMDFNSGIFRTMEKLAIVGGVATLEQEERVKNLLKMLQHEVGMRKEKLLDANVTSIRAYHESGREDMPMILVLLDNYLAFKEMYEDSHLEELVYLLREGQAVGIAFCVTIPEVGSLGLRRISYFSQRIVLHLSEQSEYSTILDGCRRSVSETPGRALYPLEKEFLEMQAYLCFDGQSEVERSAQAADFVRAHGAGERARPIPEVPAKLTRALMEEMYGAADGGFAYGMTYADVEPARFDLDKQFELALLGKNEAGKLRFLNILLEHLGQRGPEAVRVYIIDNYDRPLAPYQDAPFVVEYTIDHTQAVEMVKAAHARMRERSERVRAEGSAALAPLPLEVFIFNAREVVKCVSAKSDAMRCFNEMSDSFRKMKVLFVFGDMLNQPAPALAPELLRHIRDAKQGLIFEPLEANKLYNLDGITVRQNRAAIGKDDAYRIDEGAVARVKLVWE